MHLYCLKFASTVNVYLFTVHVRVEVWIFCVHYILMAGLHKNKPLLKLGQWDIFILFLKIFVCAGLVPDPTSLFPPELFLYVNLVAREHQMSFRTLAPRLQYWISLTSLMHIVALCVL